MAIKKLSPDLINTVNAEIKNWLFNDAERKRHDVGTTAWLEHHRKCQQYYQLLQTITGLPDKRLMNMIYNATNTATYWMPDGTIKRNY